MSAGLGWLGIVRLGLVQTALGAVVVLTTSTMNRVMVVELALPAMLPGALVGLHYAVQVTRPRWGYGSDMGGRRTPWILAGMAVLASGGVLAALATALMATSTGMGLALALVAFTLIGGGVGAAGTSLLALLATAVEEKKRAAAATIVWLMMIAGFAVTATAAGQFLDPFTPLRLIEVAGAVSAMALIVSALALWGVEGGHVSPLIPAQAATHAGGSPLWRGRADGERTPFRAALAEVWAEPRARRFAIFVFVSMIAYSAQDLILEPFAGAVFGLTPGESTKLAGVQHGGVFAGMILVGLCGSLFAGTLLGSLRAWTIVGCAASAAALIALSVAGYVGPAWPLRSSVFALGLANGAYAVAAIGSMMGLAGQGREKREGTRMGLWGAAQALAFGLGGFLGTAAADLARALYGTALPAYATVFAGEALLFLVAGLLAVRVTQEGKVVRRPSPSRSARAPHPAFGHLLPSSRGEGTRSAMAVLVPSPCGAKAERGEGARRAGEGPWSSRRVLAEGRA